MWKFLQHVNSKYTLALDDYPALYKWSVENVAEFWEEVWHFAGIKSSKPFDQVGGFHEYFLDSSYVCRHAKLVSIYPSSDQPLTPFHDVPYLIYNLITRVVTAYIE